MKRLTFQNTLLKVTLLILFNSSFEIFVSAQKGYQQKLDCFSIVVGKDATVDGSVIFGHNEDTGTRLVNFYKVPEGNNLPGDTVVFENNGRIVRERETMGYLWINRPEVDVCDSYMNEEGVAVGSDGCPSREDQPVLEDGGIVFWLRRLVAEQARTAREGVKIAGKLIEKFGYASSGRTYIIADSEEGWLLAVVHGKHWVAQRVPDDQVAVVANCYTLGEIDLSDTLNFLGSKDIVSYAIQRGWYDPDRDGIFHFAKAYANPGSLTHPGNVNRMWMAMNLLSGEKYSLKDEFPAMTRPKKKISINHVMSVLRFHYDEEAPKDSGFYFSESSENLQNASICGKETQYCFVAHLRNNIDAPLGSVLWYAPFRPDVHAFSPWYPFVNYVPKQFGFGDYEDALRHQFNVAPKTYDRKNGHAFWSYVALADKVDEDYGKYIPILQNEWSRIEVEMFSNNSKFEKDFFKMYRKSPTRARANTTKYCSKVILQQHKMIKELEKKLD